MFSISKLILKTKIKDEVIDFNNFSYIFGEHDKGKTVLLDLVDYMMGDSDYTFVGKHAMTSVNSIEVLIVTNGQELWLKRDANNCYYKFNESDKDFIRVVNVQDYKNKILEFILQGDYSVVQEYKELTDGTNIGYRSLSLFNYLQESGIADTTNVFPKSKEIGEYLNIRSIMLYIFNKDNVLHINRLKAKNLRLEKELKELKIKNDGLLYCEKLIKENMEKLSFDTNDNIDSLRKQFIEYKEAAFIKVKENGNKNLVYLIRASQQLGEEIKYQRFLSEQVKHETAAIQKSNKLLTLLTNIIIEDSSNEDIIKILRRDIENNSNNLAILGVKDYNKSIKNLQDKKVVIDRQIESINRGLDKINYEEKVKIINLLDEAFSRYSIDNYLDKIREAEKSIKENNEKIKSLKESFNRQTIIQFNTIITNIYKRFKEIDFVREDISKEGFELRFNPSKISISAIITETNKDGEVIEVNHIPGSKARMTLWQLVTYLGMAYFLKTTYKSIPFAEYIALDGVIQEFANNENESKHVLDVVKNFAYENQLQILMSGAVPLGKLALSNKEIVNINEGLNPAFVY